MRPVSTVVLWALVLTLPVWPAGAQPERSPGEAESKPPLRRVPVPAPKQAEPVRRTPVPVPEQSSPRRAPVPVPEQR
jgi:hypothetical protein